MERPPEKTMLMPLGLDLAGRSLRESQPAPFSATSTAMPIAKKEIGRRAGGSLMPRTAKAGSASLAAGGARRAGRAHDRRQREWADGLHPIRAQRRRYAQRRRRRVRSLAH